MNPARLAYTFYGAAATGAVVGQVWVGLEHIPFPDHWHTSAAVAVLVPFAACIELLGMATSALADQRQRGGEKAIGFRALSAATAATAVAIIVVGHWPRYYEVIGFGVLSGSAYTLWLLHTAARRRDALREAGLLEKVAPAYGWRWVRAPAVTARARELAVTQGLGVAESVTEATKQLDAEHLEQRAEARRRAIARAVRRVVRSQHTDRRMADLASRTLDLDRVAADLQAATDYEWWKDRLARDLGLRGLSDQGKPPESNTEATESAPRVSGTSNSPVPAVRKPRSDRAHNRSTNAERIAKLRAGKPGITNAQIATRLDISERTVQRAVAAEVQS